MKAIDDASHGADGAGSTSALSYVLSLAVANGADSGLNSDGDTINLFDVGGVIYGSTTNDINDAVTEAVFSIEVDSTGQVTSTQFEEIDHAAGGANPGFDTQVETLANGLINLTASATITDFDGDAVTDSETIDLGGNISFADDGPSVVSVTNVSVDEDGLSNGNAGDSYTDGGDLAGEAVSATGDLDIDLGADGAGSVVLSAPGATWDGTNTLAADDGSWTVVLNGDGTYTFNLLGPLTHSVMDTEDDIVLNIGYTATDGDADAVSGSFTVTVDDDAPTIADPADTDPTADDFGFADLTVGNFAGATDGSTNTDFSSGADGWQDISITGPAIDGIAYETTTSTDGSGNLVTTLTGFGDVNGNGTRDGGELDVFTFEVQGDGDYSFTLIEPENPVTEVLNTSTVSSGNPSFAETSDFTVEYVSTSGGTVNISSAGIGVSNQFIDVGEVLDVQFYNPGLVGDNDPLNLGDGAVEDTSLTAISFDNTGSGGGTLEWTVFNTVTNQTESGSIVLNGGSNGSPELVAIDPSINFNEIQFSMSSGRVRLANGQISRTLLPNGQVIDFDVTATDGDGDTVTDIVSVEVDASITMSQAPLQPKSSAPENMEDMSAIFVAANDFADNFSADTGATRGSFNSGFNGMAVLLGGMAMATEANAFENIFEQLQPTFDASGFGGFTNDFAATNFDNMIEMAFETVGGLDDLTAGTEAAFDASSFSSASPFTNDDLDAADLLGSAFEGIEAGFEAISTPDIDGTELAPQLFQAEFGMPDIATNQFFLDTELADLLAQLPEFAADGTPVAETIEAISVDTGSDVTTGTELTAFHGVMPDGVLPDGMDQGQTLTGLEDFHILAVANSIAIV